MKLAKQVVFSILPLLLLWSSGELALRVLGVAPPIVENDPYVGFAGEIPLFLDAEEEGRPVRRTAPNKLRFFNDQVFPAVKAPGTRRVFCLGGSTTYGRPYDDETSFCRWLRESLALMAPDTRWEVINAGGISYASYRVAALMRQLIEEDPDLFIVYTGHNEFLEERTYASLRDEAAWVRGLKLAMSHSRVYGAVEAGARRFREQVGAGSSPTDAREVSRLSDEVQTRLESSIGLAAYHRDDELRRAIEAHFRENLVRMAGMARSAGKQLIFVTPADNLSDCSPFKSETDRGLAAVDAERQTKLLRSGADALYRGDAVGAREAYAEAVEIDPRHAHAQYGLGRALRALGDEGPAYQAFVRAKDEDVCPLRALTSISASVRAVAADEDVPLVDFPDLLRTASGADSRHAPGAEWFLDHVHPTIAGHRLLASALLDEVHALGWLPADPADFRAAIEARERRIVQGLDTRAHGRALRNLAKVLSWAGKIEDAARAARGALSALGEDEEAHFVLSEFASQRGDPEAAIEHLRAAIRIDPDWAKAHNNLGVALMRVDRWEEALSAYDEVVRIDPEHPSVHFNRANCLRRLGRLADAAADYRTALRRDPTDGDALYNLALVYERMGDVRAALEILDRLLSIDPRDEEAAALVDRLARSERTST